MQKHRYLKSHDYASIGMDDFEEVMSVDEDTFGIVLGLAAYRHRTKPVPAPLPKSPATALDLDRVIVMVRDMDKALELFSGKMGLTFRETDKEVQKHAGNRGLVSMPLVKAGRSAYAVAAALSMKVASLTSSSVTPPASWVARVTSTLL